MPSIKEIYNSIGEVELNAESINLNVDGLEALASTQQADVALIKADLANGVTINQPVAVTDNSGSLTVDGTVTANAGTGTFAVSAASLPLPSGAATSANQSTANTSLSNIDTDLGAPSDTSASSDTGTFSLISLFKRLLSRVTTLVPANLTVTSTRLLVDGSGVTQPVSGTITANAGTGSFTVAQGTATNLNATVIGSGSFTASQATAANLNATVVQGTATNLKTQAEAYQGGSAVGSANPLQVTLANTGSNTTALQVRPRNGAITVTTGSTSGTANTSAQALASNSSRQYLLIQNISDTDMYVNFGASATTDNMLILKNGGGVVFESGFVPTDNVNVICSAASKKYFILSA